MKKIYLVCLSLIVFLASCSPVPTPLVPTSSSDLTNSTPILPMNPTSFSSPTPTLTPAIIQTFDLNSFASAWSSHDDSEIRQLYTSDGRYFTENEIRQLAQGQPVDVLVSGDNFEAQAEKMPGYTMRILGTPMMIFDKLVAFAYRWENGSDGYNGMSLLRYEAGKILLQVDLLSRQPSEEADHPLLQGNMADLAPLMRAWNEADIPAAQELYAEDALRASDEDLLQVYWRDYPTPPSLETLLLHFAGWKPEVLNDPVQLENIEIFAWRWYNRPYPVGYGLRLVRYDQDKIVTDVRIVIRPWEAQGKTFLNP